MNFKDNKWLYKLIREKINVVTAIGWFMFPVASFLLIFQNSKINHNYEIPIAIILTLISTCLFYFINKKAKEFLNKMENHLNRK